MSDMSTDLGLHVHTMVKIFSKYHADGRHQKAEQILKIIEAAKNYLVLKYGNDEENESFEKDVAVTEDEGAGH